ncbi:MAG TPA: 30S ribosome-binding factor RbfA, partial [Synergistetes bacterium]|nr:30S ribosome-binding factor RbfA [Synergistota bacterium]
LLREISDLIRTRIKDEILSEAVLFDVDCSRDIAHAKVFFRTIDPDRKDAVQKSLDKASGILRGLLGRRMKLRKIPELRFVYDTNEDEALRIEAILDGLDIEVEDNEPEMEEDQD